MTHQNFLIASDRTLDRLLLLLKSRGPQTTRQLAQALDISVPAVRQHLTRHVTLVENEAVRSGVGRPSSQWRLSAVGEGRFPDTHAELTIAMIDAIRISFGESGLETVISQNHQRNLLRYQAATRELTSTRERLECLVQLRTREGYMAELIEDGEGFLLIENHCPICAAATECQGFCQKELQLFQQILGDVQVSREEHILMGARRCAYRIEN